MGSSVRLHETLRAENLETHGPAVAEAFERFGGFDLVVLAIGMLGARKP